MSTRVKNVGWTAVLGPFLALAMHGSLECFGRLIPGAILVWSGRVAAPRRKIGVQNLKRSGLH
jgi:hypothetical protein